MARMVTKDGGRHLESEFWTGESRIDYSDEDRGTHEGSVDEEGPVRRRSGGGVGGKLGTCEAVAERDLVTSWDRVRSLEWSW